MDMKILTIASLLLLSACGKFEPDNDKLIAEAKSAIAAELSDPASAQFRSVRVASKDEDRLNGTICGEILGKFNDEPQGEYRTFIYAKLAGLASIEAVTAKGEEMSAEAAEFKKQYDEIWKSACAAG
jgi:hypothetical protein